LKEAAFRNLQEVLDMRSSFAPTLGLVSLFAVTACSSQPQTMSAVPAVSRPMAGSPNAGEAVIYVSSQGSADNVQIYARKGKNQQPITTLTGFTSPRGIFVDSKRNLWVADNVADYVYGFNPGSTTPDYYRDDAHAAPWTVVVSRNGTVYAGNQQPEYGGLFTVFDPGSDNPSSHIPATRTMLYVIGSTIDSQGDVFATYCCPTASAIGVLEIPAGTSTPKDLGIALEGGAYGIQIMKSGDMLIADFDTGIEAFHSGSTSPYLTIPPISGSAYIEMALADNQRSVYIADAGNGCVWQIAIPSGKVLNKITSGLTTWVRGVALGHGNY
jgi:hypothetical protein